MQASEPGSSYAGRDAIEAEAARLLARLNSDPSPDDEAEICAWIEADPRHAVAFARAEAAWDASERLKSAAADITLPPMQQIISEADQRRLSRNIMVAAGVAILLFVVAAIVTVRTFSGVERYETGVGQMRDIALEDGSILHLNSDSEVEARFTSNGRKVRVMKGEVSSTVKLTPLIRAASPPALATSSMMIPTSSRSRIFTTELLETKYPIKTCLFVRIPFWTTSVYSYRGEMLKCLVWMSGSETPLAVSDVMIASIAVAACLLALATVLAVASTPSLSRARSGGTAVLP